MMASKHVYSSSMILYMFAIGYILILSIFLLCVHAEVEVHPMWDTSCTSSQTCNCNVSNSEGEFTLHVHGSATDMCQLQVISTMQSATAYLPVLFKNISDTDVIYIERLDDLRHCQNKYLIIKGTSISCQLSFLHSKLEFQLHGDVDVFIGDPATANSPTSSLDCPEAQSSSTHNSEVSQTQDCNNINGYDQLISCVPQHDFDFWEFEEDQNLCSLRNFPENNFPEACTATLGNREVSVDCPNNQFFQSQTSAIMYPFHMNSLHLAFHSTVKIKPNAFDGLENILILNISNNIIDHLDEGVFNGLTNIKYLDLAQNHIETLDVDVFQGLSSLEYLDIDYNDMTSVQVGLFHGLFLLTQLDLQFNRSFVLDKHLFRDLGNLTYIDLDNNQLQALHPDLFKGLYKLEYLHLDYNQLDKLDSGIFHDQYSLIYLDLKVNQFNTINSTLLQNLHSLKTLLLGENKLIKLDEYLFKGTRELTFLDLSDNHLNEIPNILNLTNLNYFRLNDNPLIKVDNKSFIGIPRTIEFYVSQPEVCLCYTPPGINCTAATARSPYLTCHKLLEDRVLEIFMWIIGINAIGGNLFVMVWRTKYFQSNKIQSLLLSNLAMSDLLMGVYMLAIAWANIYYGDHFPMQSEIWRSSFMCRLIGAVAILSSEASVFFVTMISTDRLLDIKFPYSNKSLRRRLSKIIIGLVWFISAALGLIPSFLAGRNLNFYDNSHVCIGLPLALIETFSIDAQQTEICPANTPFCHTKTTTKSRSEGFNSGMYFSSVLFLGLNCICYVVILACYIEIIRCVYKSSKRARLNKEMKEQIKLTIKVAAIVATDFLCWFPVIILGILVQARVLVLPASVFAWSVTVILPINSAINPYLYTIAVIISKNRKRRDGEQTEHSVSRTRALVMAQANNQVHPERSMDNQMGRPPSRSQNIQQSNT